MGLSVVKRLAVLACFLLMVYLGFVLVVPAAVAQERGPAFSDPDDIFPDSNCPAPGCRGQSS